MHTNYSEGREGLETMIKKGDSLGYEYVAVTDHSRSQRIAIGLGRDKLKAQWKEIGKISKRFKIKILRGSEIEILKDGSFDYPDEVLIELGIVVGALHSGFSIPKKNDRKDNYSSGKQVLRHPCSSFRQASGEKESS